MNRLNLKYFSFEKENFPSLTLQNSKTNQLIFFEFPEPYVLSFQPIENCYRQYKDSIYQKAFFIDVYECVPNGRCAGYLFSHVSDKEMFLSHKDRVPYNNLLSHYAIERQIVIDQVKRYHDDAPDNVFGFQTFRQKQGLGSLLFGVSLRLAHEFYGSRRIVIDVTSESVSFYKKRFDENQIKLRPSHDVRILIGEW